MSPHSSISAIEPKIALDGSKTDCVPYCVRSVPGIVFLAGVAPPLAKHLLHRRADLHGGHVDVFVNRTLAAAPPTRQPQRLLLRSRGKCRVPSARRCTRPPCFMFVTRCTFPSSSMASFLRKAFRNSTHGLDTTSRGDFTPASALILTQGAWSEICACIYV